MVRERGPSRTARTFSSVFNSSVAQRPTQKSAARAFGGRPLGPNTYVPPPPKWHNEPSRQMSIFSSKTLLRTYDTPITSQLDFTGLSAPLIKPQHYTNRLPRRLVIPHKHPPK